MNEHQDKNEFFVVIHNSRSTNNFNDLARIILPGNNYKAMIWNTAIHSWVEIASDLIEQKHWRKNGTTWSDYQMFFRFIDPSATLTYLKILKMEEPVEIKINMAQVDIDRSLTVKGFSDDGEVLFTYAHKS